MWVLLLLLVCLIRKSTGVVKYKPSAFVSVDKLPTISAKEAHCVHWSRNNECIINPSVLWSQCVTDCILTSKDDNIKCFWWTDTGECTANPRYIQVHCPESCGFAIAWNPWIRKNLSIENDYSTDNLVVDQCRIPKDLLSTANIMRRRLTLYLNGHHKTEGFTDKYHDQFFTMMGMSESFLYTLRLYEIIFYYFDNSTLTDLNLERINIIYTALSSEDTDLIMRSIYGWLELIEEAHLEAGFLLSNISVNASQNAASLKNQRDFALGTTPIALADVNQFDNSPLANLTSDSSCGEVYSHSPKVDFIPAYLSSGVNPGLFSGGSVSQYYTELQETYNAMNDVYDELDLSGFAPSSLNRRRGSSRSLLKSHGTAADEFTTDSTVTLSNGVVMPVLGFGTYFLDGQTLSDAVRSALEVGYRMFDTHNNSYADAAGLGAALNSAIDQGVVTRSDLFVVSKYAQNGANLTVENCTDTIQQQLGAMGLDYIDLYLLDGRPEDDLVEAAMWEALEIAYRAGWVRAIGVSNYYSYGVTMLMSSAKVRPMVIQNKLDVYHIGKGIDVYGDNMLEIALYYNIVLMGYSPLSGTPFFMRPVDDPIVRYVAAHHLSIAATLSNGTDVSDVLQKQGASSISRAVNRTLNSPTAVLGASDITTPAQVLLRWSLQHHVVTLTQSTKRSRQLESYNALRIHPLSKQEMSLLNSIQHLVSSPLSVPILV